MRHLCIGSTLLASALVLAACGGSGSESSPSTFATANAPTPAGSADTAIDEADAVVDISALGADSITVEPFADFLMSSGDLAWVSGVDPGIVAYDEAMSTVFEVEAGRIASALEFGHGFIWAAEAPDFVRPTTLLRIDPATGKTKRFKLPSPGVPSESSLAVTDEAVWAIIQPKSQGGEWTVVGVDPQSGVRVARFPVGTDEVAAVRGGFGSLWITRPTGLLARIDAASGDKTEIRLPFGSAFLSVGADSVWVMNSLGSVTRVDPSTESIVATVSVSPEGINGGDIAASTDAVWVQAAAFLGVEIDPSTNSVVQRVGPAEGSGSVTMTDDGAVWITAHDADKLYRIPPG